MNAQLQNRVPGLVTVKRTKGRIPGFAKMSVPTEILVCGSNRPRKKEGDRKDGWSFPPAVSEVMIQAMLGETCLHLPFPGIVYPAGLETR